jgi:hypothetical protein
MKKIIIAALVLGACANPRAAALKGKVDSDTKYKLEDVKVSLESKCEAGGFPDEAGITETYTKKAREKFCMARECTDNPSAGDITVSANVVHKRVFMGEGFGCGSNPSYGHASMRYSYELKQDGAVLYSKELSEEYVPNRGLFGNIGRIATQISFTGDADNELDDIDYLSSGLANVLAGK